MKLEVKRITPEMAMELLEKNSKNRRLKKDTVLDYADQMNRGQWKLTGQGITISKDGDLIDGQHRLAAIVKSNKTIEMVISYGLDYEDVFKVYDTGARRTSADALYIENVKHSSLVSAIIKKKISYDKNKKYTMSGSVILKITNTDVSNEYNINKDIYLQICQLSYRCYGKIKFMSTSYIGGVAAHLILTKGHSFELVSSFFEQLFYNENVENATIIALRNKFINNALDNKKLPEIIKTLYIIKTWNCFLNGKELTSLRIDTNTESTMTFN